VVAKAKLPTASEVRREIYVDFEGFEGKPPLELSSRRRLSGQPEGIV